MEYEKFPKTSNCNYPVVASQPKARFYSNNANKTLVNGDNLYFANDVSANYYAQVQYAERKSIANVQNSFPRQRFMPYNKRTYANVLVQQNSQQRFLNYFSQLQQQQQMSFALPEMKGESMQAAGDAQNQSVDLNGSKGGGRSFSGAEKAAGSNENADGSVTLQISNLDTSLEERVLKQYLVNKLKPITSVISIYFETLSVAKIKLPSASHAKQVIAFLHRKKIGHKRITVSYTRDSSSLEPSTLRCQVIGLLKVSCWTESAWVFAI